ncbi:MAG: hypothetical protein Q8O10_07165 [candidate division Zixibacteria bacterium]|nr:hypothetical protein [candidate division Zixibacteria bacterium]
MNRQKTNERFLRFPVLSHGAEFLVQGHLMRRNILTYKAPPNNEGYDLICIHPNPRVKSKQVRVQVKSRYQTDCNRSVPVKEKSLGAFDFLIVVFLNVGYFYKKTVMPTEGRKEPECYTLPVDFVKKHLDKRYSWQKIILKDFNIDKYKNEKGFELIAKRLKINYPSRVNKG